MPRPDLRAYDSRQKRLHALFDSVAHLLPDATIADAHELVDANEAPIALDMVSEVVAERGSSISRSIFDEFDRLSSEFELGPETANRLLPLIDSNYCPVCGYDGLTEPVRTPRSGGGSYEICPSCGFQFGVTDDDLGHTYASWREEWIRRGLPWSGAGQPPPLRWDPQIQLAKWLQSNAGH